MIALFVSVDAGVAVAIDVAIDVVIDMIITLVRGGVVPMFNPNPSRLL